MRKILQILKNQGKTKFRFALQRKTKSLSILNLLLLLRRKLLQKRLLQLLKRRKPPQSLQNLHLKKQQKSHLESRKSKRRRKLISQPHYPFQNKVWPNLGLLLTNVELPMLTLTPLSTRLVTICRSTEPRCLSQKNQFLSVKEADLRQETTNLK